MTESAAIILAAGKSTRMKGDLPKVLHEVCGRPMLAFVLEACRLAGVERLLVIVGHGQELVRRRFEADADLVWIEQPEQHGTGHAVMCGRAALNGFEGSVLVIAGDMPLVRRVTLAQLLEIRERNDDALTLATAELPDPAGYGRIVRDAHRQLLAIVEDRDCTEEQRAIREVNPSYYCFHAPRLFDALEATKANHRTGEYYLTDVVQVLRSRKQPVTAFVRLPAQDALGINSRLDLAVVGRAMQDRIQLALMNDGVTIVDPDNTWIEAGAVIGADTVVYPFSFIGAGATLGEGCRVGPFARIASGEYVSDHAVVGPTDGVLGASA